MGHCPENHVWLPEGIPWYSNQKGKKNSVYHSGGVPPRLWSSRCKVVASHVVSCSIHITPEVSGQKNLWVWLKILVFTAMVGLVFMDVQPPDSGNKKNTVLWVCLEIPETTTPVLMHVFPCFSMCYACISMCFHVFPCVMHVFPCVSMFFHVLCMYFHVFPCVSMFFHVFPCFSMFFPMRNDSFVILLPPLPQPFPPSVSTESAPRMKHYWRFSQQANISHMLKAQYSDVAINNNQLWVLFMIPIYSTIFIVYIMSIGILMLQYHHDSNNYN